MTKSRIHEISFLTTLIRPLLAGTAWLGMASCVVSPPADEAGADDTGADDDEDESSGDSTPSEDESTGDPDEGGATSTSGGTSTSTSTGASTSGTSTSTSTGTSTSDGTTSTSTSTGDDTTSTTSSTTEGDASTTGDSPGETSPGCGQSPPANGRRTINVGGSSRDYILRVPDDYDPERPYRLILAYHWRDGNASQVANGGEGGSTEDPFYGLWDLAENSTIFVAPEGRNAGWYNMGDEDIAFTDAILEQLFAELCIDTSRIFATGFSFGAGMSYALACARPDVFRGVALYAGAQLSGCNGGNTPVAFFAAHGVRDSVLGVAQGRQLRDRFVQVNGCTPQDPPEPARDSGTHICTSYEGCMEGYPVRWCAHGGDHNPTEKDSGQSKSWVPGEAWAFISQF